MKLHQDTNAFRVLIEDIHKKTGYRTDVLEKDYYVVLILSELAEKQKDGLQKPPKIVMSNPLMKLCNANMSFVMSTVSNIQRR